MSLYVCILQKKKKKDIRVKSDRVFINIPTPQLPTRTHQKSEEWMQGRYRDMEIWRDGWTEGGTDGGPTEDQGCRDRTNRTNRRSKKEVQ